MKIYALILSIFFIALISGCNDSTTNPLVNGKTRMELLTSHIWYIESPLDEDPSYIVKYNTNGTMYYYKKNNTIKRTANWKFQANETQIAGEDIVDIVTLDETNLVIRWNQDGESMTVTYKAAYNNSTVQQQFSITGTLDIKDAAINLNDYNPIMVWGSDVEKKVYLSEIGTISGNNTFQINIKIPSEEIMLEIDNDNLVIGSIELLPKSLTNNQLIDYDVVETQAKGGIYSRYIVYIKDKYAVEEDFVSMFNYQNGLQLTKRWMPFDKMMSCMPIPNESSILIVSSYLLDFKEIIEY